jgi:hypothetical protein
MKITIALVVLLSACASIPRATVQGRLAEAWTQISSSEFVRVRGIGVANTKVRGLTRRRGLSRDAALVAARYNLLALIKGVRLSGGITVSQLIERDSLIAEVANEVVSGGEEVLTEWTKDGGCVVTLELKRSTVEQLIQKESQRERDLALRVAQDMEEIQSLAQALAEAIKNPINKMDGCDIEAIQEKALRLQNLQDGHVDMQFFSFQQPRVVYDLATEIERARELDVKEMAAEMRVGGCDFPTQRSWDDLERRLRADGYYSAESIAARGGRP